MEFDGERHYRQCPIPCLSLRRHAREHRHVHVDIVVNNHFFLPVVVAMQAPDVLRKRSLLGDRHGEEQSIEPGIVEPFTEIAAGCKDYSRLDTWRTEQRVCVATFGGFHRAANARPSPDR
jgi:hypothetical protein